MNTSSRSKDIAGNRPSKATFVRRRAIAAVAGVVAMVGIYHVGKDAVDTVQRNALIERIADSKDHALADFNDGKLKGDDLLKYTTEQNGTAFGDAVALTKGGENALDLQGVIMKQQGEKVPAGTSLILPKELVSPDYIQVAELQNQQSHK